MSEYTLNSSKSTGALGLTLTLRNFRRYLIIGIIIPLILSIPAMIVQGIWIRHDKEGTFPGMRIEYLDSVPAEVEDRFEKVNGKYEIVTEENWDLKDRVYAFTQTAFYLLIAALGIFLIRDMLQAFWGKRAALEAVVPCSKPVLFLGMFIPASICALWSIFLMVVSEYFIEGGLSYIDGTVKMVHSRHFEAASFYMSQGVPMQWETVRGVFSLFLLIYLGLAVLFALCGKLKKTRTDSFITIVIAAIGVVIAAGHYMAVQLSYEWQINYVLFIIPLILLVFCIMLLRKHDLISS